MTPNFFLVGAAKAGTTSIWQYLQGHPEIFMSDTAKEPHYFLWAEEQNSFDLGDWQRVEKPYHSSWDAYLKLFEGAGEPVVGEASVFYLAHPSAPQKIHARCPDAKILMVLREPVSRAYSWYNFNRMRHEESCPSFRAALERELASENLYYANQYIGLGLYADQVQRYIGTFGRDRVKVVLFDDLRADASAVLRDVFEFLGVDPNCSIDTTRQLNPTLKRHPVLDAAFKLKASGGLAGKVARGIHGTLAGSRTYLRVKQVAFDLADIAASRKKAASGESFEKISSADRDFLMAHFQPDIERLEGIIGRDLSAWKAQAAVQEPVQEMAT